MRTIILTAMFLSMSLGAPRTDVPGADTNPYIKLTQEIKDGTLRISAKNVSQKPILAYVIAVEDGGQITTHHDYYTGRGSFGPGKTIQLTFAVHSTSISPRVLVDYLRLGDRSTWGNTVTDDGKDVSASFEK